MHSRHLAALLLTGALACEASVKPCPPGTVADGERARALLAAVAPTQAGQPAIDSPTICFGSHGRGTVRPDGVIVLADSLDSDAAAARLTHMQMHVADGLHHFPVAALPCEPQVEAALAAEARAIVAEIEACDRLTCDAAPYTFAAAVLAAAPTERAGQVLARLKSEPETDDLDVLVRDYRTRCERRE